MSKPLSLPQYIVVYRPHGILRYDTKFYGAFNSYLEAEDFLEALPALGVYDGSGIGGEGVKYIQELTAPEVEHGA